MLVIQWLVHSALAFATTTFSQHIRYSPNLQLEQPLRLGESEISNNPLFSLHKKLVNIESISGNEQAVGEFLEAYLKSHNYTVERQYLDPLPTSLRDSHAEEFKDTQKQRFNLLAYPRENRQTPVLLSSVSTLSEPSSPSLSRILSLNTCSWSKKPKHLFQSSSDVPLNPNFS